MHRPAAESNVARGIAPGEAVHEPIDIVALGMILARMRAAAFGAVQSGADGDRGLRQKIVELECLHEGAVPDETVVADTEISEPIRGPGDLVGACPELA